MKNVQREVIEFISRLHGFSRTASSYDKSCDAAIELNTGVIIEGNPGSTDAECLVVRYPQGFVVDVYADQLLDSLILNHSREESLLSGRDVKSCYAEMSKKRPGSVTPETLDQRVFDVKKEMVKFLHDFSASEHSELMDAWHKIDAKAQATVSIAGVLVAAVFVFVRNGSVCLDLVGKLAILLELVLLVFVIVLSVMAMWVRKIPMPMSGSNTYRGVQELFEVGESDLLKSRINFIFDAVRVFEEVNEGIREGVYKKSSILKGAQGLIVVACVIIFVITAYCLLVRGG